MPDSMYAQMKEWPYPVNYGKENVVEVDVLFVGGGIAGCHGAISALKKGATVAVVDKGPVIRSGAGGAGVDHWHLACTNPASQITPDEIMTMHPATQILALAHANPVVGYRTAYFLDKRFRGRRGRPFFDIHPHYRDRPVPSAHDFTSSRVDVGGLLHRHISAG